jgi:DNA-binding transcriptional ArsR family regulator
MKSEQLDRVFAVLAHEGRRQMLDLLVQAPGMTMKALASHFDMSRIAVLKHVRALESAELVLSKKEGRSRHLFFNPVPLQLIYDRWTTEYSGFWSSRIADIKASVEGKARAKRSHRSA